MLFPGLLPLVPGLTCTLKYHFKLDASRQLHHSVLLKLPRLMDSYDSISCSFALQPDAIGTHIPAYRLGCWLRSAAPNSVAGLAEQLIRSTPAIHTKPLLFRYYYYYYYCCCCYYYTCTTAIHTKPLLHINLPSSRFLYI